MSSASAWLTAAVLVACSAGAGPSISDRPAAGDGWGPLAVVPPSQGSDDALAVGILHVADACVSLEGADGEKALLVWPSDRTRWDAATRAIGFTNFDGESVTFRDGDRVSLGGGGDRTEESGLSGQDWVERLQWVAPPDASCPLESRWFVGEVVTDR